jgi:hypothetical protein
MLFAVGVADAGEVLQFVPVFVESQPGQPVVLMHPATGIVGPHAGAAA